MIGKRKHIRMKLRHGASNPLYLASCFGKQRHASYEAAKEATLAKPSIVGVYKCKFGNHYHIGRKQDGSL